jgi:antitoxin Phd
MKNDVSPADLQLSSSGGGELSRNVNYPRVGFAENKVHFSELLEASLKEGPQILTRQGVEVAVLVPIDKWRRLEQAARSTLKDLLLAESPRAEIPVPPRQGWRPARPRSIP